MPLINSGAFHFITITNHYSMKSLQKQALNAPQYTFYLKNHGFISDDQGLRGVKFTDDMDKAMNYAEGFDNEELKLNYWNAMIRLYSNDKALSFEKIVIDGN